MKLLKMSFKRFKTWLIVFAITFLLLMLIFVQFEVFSRVKVPNGTAPNYVITGILRGVPCDTAEGLGLGGNVQIVTDKGFEAQNFSGSDVGSKNDSFTNSTKDSPPYTRTPSDKLLGGLLASGFDEGSCLSRFQSYLYRKLSPHKPSSYLIHKLRDYEDRHKRCGPHTRSYNKTMIRLKRSRNNGATDTCNYIVWTPERGMGNRMVSMVSTFLYALLTDRVLLVEFHNDMVGLFCEPFPNSSWILPNDFPFSNNQIHVETYQSMQKKDWKNNSRQISSSSVLHLKLGSTHELHETLFHCDHSQHALRKTSLLILHSDLYFVPSLFMVPSFNQELSKMFPEKDTIFHHLGRYLFHPSNELWGLITRFYQAYLAKADERIGLQIRLFNPDLTPHQTIMDQVLRCTLKHKILPELSTQELMAARPLRNQTLKSVVVTSLYPEYGENLRNMYMTKPTVNGEVIGIYQPSHEEQQKFNDSLHNIKALTEIYLLSLSDVLVTSSKSTFGYVAQSLGGLKPWFLYKLLDKNIPDPPCQRCYSMEPCFHGPPEIDCMAKSIDDIGTAFPSIRSCEDFSFGIKLVNDYE